MAQATSDRSLTNIPAPPSNRYIGHTQTTMRFAKDSIGFSRPLFQQYGKVVSLIEGKGLHLYSNRPQCPATVIAYGPEQIQQVASHHNIYYKQPLTGPLYRLRMSSERSKPLNHFMVGLFGANEEHHLQQRKLMMPAFHRQHLNTYAQDMIDIARDELNRLHIGQVYDISSVMRQLTLRIATKTLFGEDVGSEGKGVGLVIQEALRLQLSVFLRLFPFDLPGFPWHKYLNLLSQYESAMEKIIAAKRKTQGQDPDVLSMLIQVRDEDSGDRLTEAELLGHVGVLFAAGHETSANALTWTLFLLSQHPQVMADLRDELDAVLQGGEPSFEHLANLPLLERVIKESMRVLPPVPWNGRVTSKETELGGHLLPAGTEVMLSLYQTHHMPELYSDPNSFDPHRWETITPTNYEYVPFSAGPRICIGAGFAMMEIKLVLAILLQKFRLEFTPQKAIDRSGFIVVTPKHGLSMKVQSPDRQFNLGVGEVKGNVHEMVNLPRHN